MALAKRLCVILAVMVAAPLLTTALDATVVLIKSDGSAVEVTNNITLPAVGSCTGCTTLQVTTLHQHGSAQTQASDSRGLALGVPTSHAHACRP